MRATDRFRIGSVTKTFVATVVIQLVGEGRLSLTDTVEDRLPGLVPNGQAITVRQLLNMTSGLFDYPDDPRIFAPFLQGDPAHAWTPRELVAVATSHAPLFAPGTGYAYCNTCYVLLGLMIEAASGNPLNAELRQRILEPLRLRATSLPTTPRIAGRHAHGYLRVGQPSLEDVTALSPSWGWAAGAIVSTADDIARFYRALLSGRLLRPKLLRAMRTTVAGNAAARYGLGIGTLRLPCGTAGARVARGGTNPLRPAPRRLALDRGVHARRALLAGRRAPPAGRTGLDRGTGRAGRAHGNAPVRREREPLPRPTRRRSSTHGGAAARSRDRQPRPNSQVRGSGCRRSSAYSLARHWQPPPRAPRGAAMTAEAYGTHAGIYDWPVPDELLKPPGTIAAFPDVIDESDNGARVRAPSPYTPEIKRYP